MFERFTESARQVVVNANDAARELGHPHIGTEHVLLGLLADPASNASRVLNSLGVTAERARERVVEVVPPGDHPTNGQIPFAPRAKRVLELALRESLSHGSTAVGTGAHPPRGGARTRASRLASCSNSVPTRRRSATRSPPPPVPRSRCRGVPEPDTFEWFTDRACQVVVLAQAEVRELGFSHIGTEAVLLGLLREEEGLAARVLTSFDVTLELARAEVVKHVGTGDGISESTVIPFTPRAQSVLAERCTRRCPRPQLCRHRTVLLSMAAVDESEGMNALGALGVDSTMIRNAVMRLFGPPRPPDAGRILE